MKSARKVTHHSYQWLFCTRYLGHEWFKASSSVCNVLSHISQLVVSPVMWCGLLPKFRLCV